MINQGMMIDIINQILMFIFGAGAIWTVGRTEDWSRWGYIFGLCGQPFWIYAAVKTNQYGMLILVMFYTYSWAQGIYNHWIKKKKI